ncbi:MAG: type II toxin-antitoxin system VapB family antitoxin [Pseudomonadota bacterium]
MPALNLKSDEAHRLARELADLTGQSLTDAVIDALKRRRDELRTQRAPDSAKVERLLDYGRRFRARLDDRPVPASTDMSDLYDDETGLPR